MPNLLFFPTSCVCLEPRPLSSTGITRLLRYYGPLRHPKTPRTSLTGFRLIVPDHAKGLPVSPAIPLCTCCRHYPGTASGCFCSLHQTYKPSPHWRTGRPVHRPFRGLLSVYSRYGLHTRQVTYVTLYTRGFSHFVTSMTALIASGWSKSCRVGLAPTGISPPSTAHAKCGHSVEQWTSIILLFLADWTILDFSFGSEHHLSFPLMSFVASPP